LTKLTPEEAQLFLEPNYAVASTVRGDGCPQTTVVWVDYDGENVVFNTAEGRYKPRYIRENGRAGVHVTHPEDPYRWVSVAGPAELTHEGADEHIDKLAKKYLGADSYPYRREGEQRVIVRIKPEHVNSSGLDGH
jgi:PPOX class probable F420-dependent enzyme